MKILFVTTAFPRWMGDHQAPFLLEEVKQLSARGQKVTVIAMHCPGAKSHEEMDGVEIYRTRYLPERLEILRKEEGGIPASFKKSPWYIIALGCFFIMQVMAVLKRCNEFDLIHAQWTLSGFIAWAVALIKRKPYIVTLHGSDMVFAGKYSWVRWFTKLCLNNAKKVIAVSHALANDCRKMGIKDELIEVIPNGVDTDFFVPGFLPKKNTLLYVGSLTNGKGVNYLIESMPIVWNCYPDVDLIITGDGPQRISWLELSEKFNKNKIHFTGTKNREEIRLELQQSKILVLPSLHEGFGVVLIEALACGTPCIASRVGGIPDILNENVGILVNPGNANDLADAILQLLSDQAIYDQMRVSARKHAVEHFGWQITSQKLINTYLSICKNK